jgi:hypothetical protein
VSRIASGFFFGLGFSLAAAAVVWAAVAITKHFEPSAPATQEANRIWHKRFDANAGVSVESHRARPTKNNVYVVGSVRNAGKDSWDGVHLEVRLLDGKGELLRVCRGLVIGPVRPEQVRDFQVDCQGSGWEPVPMYAEYTIEIVDARYEMDDGT